MARTFQITALFPSLSVLENVLLACQALDRRKFALHKRLSSYDDLRRKAAGLLAAVDLADRGKERVGNLSHGDQRKLEVALSLAGRPRLLLLDEPMAGLSPGERGAMQRLLETLDPAITVLLIEHDMDVAFGFADKLTVLHQGRVLTEGGKDEISANPSVQQVFLGSQMG